MPVFFVEGSIADSDAQTITCTVNTVGVMGAGVAKWFKEQYPTLYVAYKRACRGYFFRTNRNFLWDHSPTRKVLCMPTKMHWKNPSKIEWIEAALNDIAKNYEKYGITELAMPPPGCGNGGLLWWEEVEPVVSRILGPLPLKTTVYLPYGWLDCEPVV